MLVWVTGTKRCAIFLYRLKLNPPEKLWVDFIQTINAKLFLITPVLGVTRVDGYLVPSVNQMSF